MEKIDIHHTDRRYDCARARLLVDERILEGNRLLILRFLDDSAIGKTARVKARVKSVGIRARLKNLYLLKTVGLYFRDRPLKNLTVGDIEEFVRDLNEDRVKGAKDIPFAGQTKANIKKTLIIFLRWLFGERARRFYDMTYWIDTRFKAKDIPSIEEADVKQILQYCTTIRQKVLVTCLFDGGFRIEEFLNVRNSDVKLVPGPVPFYRIRIRNEFSKTKGRDVSMFWAESYDVITAWHSAKPPSSAEEPFFSGTYNGVRKTLCQLGARIAKRLNPHLFRHSSATFYANKGLNEFQMNKRYGWTQGSDMGRKYVDQSKIYEQPQVNEYEESKFSDLREQLRHQEEENRILLDSQQSLKEDNELFRRELETFRGEIGAVRRTAQVLAKQLGYNLREPA